MDVEIGGAGRSLDGGATVIAVVNQKGGVGKSTTSINLGYGLARWGRRVLLVDLDPQASLSESVGVFAEPKASMQGVFEQELRVPDILREFDVQGAEGRASTGVLHLAPAEISMLGLEVYLRQQIGYHQILAEALQEVRGDYDVVILDCSPDLGALEVCAATAARYVLIPVQAQRMPANATRNLMEFLEGIRGRVNPTLEILGVLITMVEARTKVAREMVGHIREQFKKRGERVFTTEIRRNTTLAEVPNRRVSIFEHDPNSAGAEDYENLTKEVISHV